MPFQVKATVAAFLGDAEKYPCHFGHHKTDEIVFDGERYIGRLCPDVWPMLTQKAAALHVAGPRYIDPIYYYPFWYAPCSKYDPSMKRYDGLGYRNVLQTPEMSSFNRGNLLPPNAFKWPPHSERTVARDVAVICPDSRTSVLFALEAFDLSAKGFDTPFFRRQMTILDKVLKKGAVETGKILDTFSEKSRNEIYPALSPQLMLPLIEELTLMGYLEIKDGAATVTAKGQDKLRKFKSSLSDKEKDALQI
jgi:hypothetical protein